MHRFFSWLLAAAGLCLAGCGMREEEGPPAVRPFSIRRYMGVWHEAARMPHVFERGMEYVTAEYRLQADGTVRVINRGSRKGQRQEITGFARQKIRDTGELEVSFFRPFYGMYRIVALDRNYTAALVVGSGKKAWILVRDPAQAETVLPGYLEILKQWGFDNARLEYPAMAPPSGPSADHRSL